MNAGSSRRSTTTLDLSNHRYYNDSDDWDTSSSEESSDEEESEHTEPLRRSSPPLIAHKGNNNNDCDRHQNSRRLVYQPKKPIQSFENCANSPKTVVSNKTDPDDGNHNQGTDDRKSGTKPPPARTKSRERRNFLKPLLRRAKSMDRIFKRVSNISAEAPPPTDVSTYETIPSEPELKKKPLNSKLEASDKPSPQSLEKESSVPSRRPRPKRSLSVNQLKGGRDVGMKRSKSVERVAATTKNASPLTTSRDSRQSPPVKKKTPRKLKDESSPNDEDDRRATANRPRRSIPKKSKSLPRMTRPSSVVKLATKDTAIPVRNRVTNRPKRSISVQEPNIKPPAERTRQRSKSVDKSVVKDIGTATKKSVPKRNKSIPKKKKSDTKEASPAEMSSSMEQFTEKNTTAADADAACAATTKMSIPKRNKKSLEEDLDFVEKLKDRTTKKSNLKNIKPSGKINSPADANSIERPSLKRAKSASKLRSSRKIKVDQLSQSEHVSVRKKSMRRSKGELSKSDHTRRSKDELSKSDHTRRSKGELRKSNHTRRSKELSKSDHTPIVKEEGLSSPSTSEETAPTVSKNNRIEERETTEGRETKPVPLLTESDSSPRQRENDTNDGTINDVNDESDDNEEGEDQDEVSELHRHLAQMGIKPEITVAPDFDDDMTAMMSVGAESYVLDLAAQKQNREHELKEEALDDAFLLYQKAVKAGLQESEKTFLDIYEHTQDKLQQKYQEHYNKQDERLEEAVAEILKKKKYGGSLR